MIGLDIVSISRIEGFIERFGERALDRFMSKSEQESFKSYSSRAGIWAAKEAISKSLGCGISKDFGFLDVEIKRDRFGAPKAFFSEEVRDRFDIKSVSISITHDGGFAASVSFVEFCKPML